MIAHTRNTRVEVPDNALSDNLVLQNNLTDDEAILNLTGQRVSDRAKRKGILHCKKYTFIGKLNVRTIKESTKRLELVNNFKKSKVNILGINDHKIVHEDELVKIEHINGCTLISSSVWRTSNGAAQGGVGILIDRQPSRE